MHRRKEKQTFHEKGQGLVEYALILVLVAVVVIVIVSLLGEQVQNVFCEIVYSLGDFSPTVEACEAPHVTCNGVADGATITSGSIALEAVVQDNNGVDGIQRVDFYIDGSTTPAATEYYYRFCLGGSDATCDPYSTSGMSSGTHTITAVATDADGFTGQCTVRINIP